jgi:hypothetical protein
MQILVACGHVVFELYSKISSFVGSKKLMVGGWLKILKLVG